MLAPERQIFYLVGTPKARIQQQEKMWPDLPCEKVRNSVEVKLCQHEGSSMSWPRVKSAKPKKLRCGAHAAGPAVAQAAGQAPEFTPSGSVAAAHRGCEEGNGSRLRVRQDSPAGNRRVGHAPDFSFQLDKTKLLRRRTTRWTLPSGQQSDQRRPSGVVTPYVQLTQMESVFRSSKERI